MISIEAAAGPRGSKHGSRDSLVLQVHALEAGELRLGLQGLTHTVPPGFAAESVLRLSAPPAATAHAGAVAAAFAGWGDVLLARAAGVRTPPAAAAWISQLGYSFTGAYHYSPCAQREPNSQSPGPARPLAC